MSDICLAIFVVNGHTYSSEHSWSQLPKWQNTSRFMSIHICIATGKIVCILPQVSKSAEPHITLSCPLSSTMSDWSLVIILHVIVWRIHSDQVGVLIEDTDDKECSCSILTYFLHFTFHSFTDITHMSTYICPKTVLVRQPFQCEAPKMFKINRTLKRSFIILTCTFFWVAKTHLVVTAF